MTEIMGVHARGLQSTKRWGEALWHFLHIRAEEEQNLLHIEMARKMTEKLLW